MLSIGLRVLMRQSLGFGRDLRMCRNGQMGYLPMT